MKVVILPEVVDYLLELSDILYEKGYIVYYVRYISNNHMIAHYL